MECFVLTERQYQAFPETECPGNDLGNTAASHMDCHRICSVITDCVAFSYNSHDKRCWLKQMCVNRIHSPLMTVNLWKGNIMTLSNSSLNFN